MGGEGDQGPGRGCIGSLGIDIHHDRHVRLEDGTEGYVKAAYVVYEPPAKLIVNETQAEVERLSSELAEAKAAFAEPAAVMLPSLSKATLTGGPFCVIVRSSWPGASASIKTLRRRGLA